jgi:hypothetical protein
LEATGWGRDEVQSSTGIATGQFVQLPAELLTATIAAMGGRQEADDADEERQTAEDMAQAACLVPSLMAAKQEEMATWLHVLVEWATLETKRPYPLDTIGRGIGRDRDRAGAQPTWGKRKVRVLLT